MDDIFRLAVKTVGDRQAPGDSQRAATALQSFIKAARLGATEEVKAASTTLSELGIEPDLRASVYDRVEELADDEYEALKAELAAAFVAPTAKTPENRQLKKTGTDDT